MRSIFAGIFVFAASFAALADDAAVKQFQHGLEVAKPAIAAESAKDLSYFNGSWLATENMPVAVTYDVYKTDSLISPEIRGFVQLKYKMYFRQFENIAPSSDYSAAGDKAADAQLVTETLNFRYAAGAWLFVDGVLESVSAPGTKYDAGPTRFKVATVERLSSVSKIFARALIENSTETQHK